MPRASLRSVFTTIADSAAFTWRVSSNTTSSPPCVRPACSYCDSGPALAAILSASPPGRAGRGTELAPRAHSPPWPLGRSVRSHPPRTHCSVPVTRRPGITLHGCPSRMLGADPFGPRSLHHPEGQPPRLTGLGSGPLRHLAPVRAARQRSVSGPLLGLLVVGAWVTLWPWAASPYGRYLDHGSWLQAGSPAPASARALPAGEVLLLPGGGITSAAGC